MGSFAILGLLSILMMAFLPNSEAEDTSEETPDTPDEPDIEDLPPDPDEPLDTGASFAVSSDGVSIELGDDETRTLAVIYYTDYEDTGTNVATDADEARFYLVPEGVDWSDQSWETANMVPGADQHEGGRYAYELEDFEAHFGLELLGTVNLLNVADNPDDPSALVGEITANAPIEEYYLRANTDGDDLISFLPEDYIITYNGVPENSVVEDTLGTDATDWISAGTPGITIDGAGGNDLLETVEENVTLFGGQGDDVIRSYGANALISGGDGEDDIYAFDNATIDGGAGNDLINSRGGTSSGGEGDDTLYGYGEDDAPAAISGDGGNDTVVVYGPNAVAHGNDGDDFLGVNDGATGYGGDGNDRIQLESGSTGFGGDGDDLFTVWNQFRDDDGPAIITTGTGEDTINARVWNAANGEAEDIYLRVTDFDVDNDILQVGSFQTNNSVDSFEIVEATDGSYTDVRVTFTPLGFSPDPGIAVIRLDGTTGLNNSHIVVMT